MPKRYKNVCFSRDTNKELKYFCEYFYDIIEEEETNMHWQVNYNIYIPSKVKFGQQLF